MWDSLGGGVLTVIGMQNELLAALALLGSMEDPFVLVGQTFAPLAHPLRRKVLALLLEDAVVEREALAATLAADDDVPREDRHGLETVLHHHHLPKLADGQYIDYDTRSGDVVLWRDPCDVEDELECP